MFRSKTLSYVSELENRYTALENKCKTQETVIERLSKNYYDLKRKFDKATMNFWLSWYKIGEESDEALEINGWYLIIVPDCDHPVVAQYMGRGGAKCFIAMMPYEKRIIHKDLVKYWADLPCPELFCDVEKEEE